MKRISINDGWRYYREAGVQFPLGEKGSYESVRLPHTNALLPYNYASAREYQFVCGYERALFAPLSWSGRRAFVTFEGAAHRAEVFLNGEKLASHACGYTAFTLELTDKLRLGDENTLSVLLDSRESLDQPPFGGRIDYLTYGGLYREAYVELAEETYIADVFAATPALDELRFDVTPDGPPNKGAALFASVFDADETELFHKKYDVAENALRFHETIEGAKPWSCEEPNLYELRLSLVSGQGEVLDEKTVRFGFRTVAFRADGFYLNGEKRKLRGLNRHQSYPYIGYAAPKSLQRFDADVLRYELGLNAVRTSHYPQSRHFLDRCDEIGLLVFTEIPGWQHIGGDAWKDEAVKSVREMVRQNRNHPCIFLWGVRINESQDDDALYLRTNAAAHELDDTRPTSGVRYLEKSHLLEDVYAYNDFSHSGNNAGLKRKRSVTKNPRRGYLVSEFNGHMFPTKAFDDEAHRLSHALRHANVLEAMYANRDIAGCFGWCMADYNTHGDFGAGDGVCYHGVLDMFRNAKLAASVYRAQAEGESVLAVSSTMDLGEHAAGNIGAVYAFTNADSVNLYKGDELVRVFAPDSKNYGHMPHPPVVIDDFIGDLIEQNEPYPSKVAAKVKALMLALGKYGLAKLPLKYKALAAQLMLFRGFTTGEGARLYDRYVGGWGSSAARWRFEAVKDGEVAAVAEKGAPEKVCIVAGVDHTELHEGETYDMALVRIRAQDAAGNRLAYFQEPVSLIVQGPIALVGPDVVSLKGGAFGALVKTTGMVGEAKLIISAEQAGETAIDFTIV